MINGACIIPQRDTDCLQVNPVGSPPKHNKNQKEQRKKWTREVYKEVMYCFYFALEKPQINNTDDTFLKWIERNSESEKVDAMDSNKLANVRRYVMKEKKLCDAELVEIKERAKNDTRMEVDNEKDV